MGRTKGDMKNKAKKTLGALLLATLLLAAVALPTGAKPGDNIMQRAKLYQSTGYINDEEQDVFLFDGDYDTKWCATIGDARYPTSELKRLAQEGFIHILAVDFGEEKYFDSYRLYLASTGARDYGITSYNATAWKIQISSDGAIWKEVSRVTDCWDEEIVTVNIGVRKARYLRILVDEPEQSGGKTVRLYELEVFECEPGELATGVVRTNGSNVKAEAKETEAAKAQEAELLEGEEPEESEDIELGYVPSEAIEYEGYELGIGGVIGIVVLAAIAAAISVLASHRAKKEQLY